jgi:hypothetical protein
MIIWNIEPSLIEIASHRRALEQRQSGFMLPSETERAESNCSAYSGSISVTAPFCRLGYKRLEARYPVVMGRMSPHTKTRDLNSTPFVRQTF